MRGLTLLQVLMTISGLAAEYHGATDQFPYADDTSMFPGGVLHGGLEGYHASFGTHQTDNRRHKRGMSSVYRAAWVRLLDKTREFKWMQMLDGSRAKFYVKLGSPEDARADFYSLRPTGIARHEGDILVGEVGNQKVALQTFNGSVGSVRMIGSETERVIMYFETPQQADTFLRNLQYLDDY